MLNLTIVKYILCSTLLQDTVRYYIPADQFGVLAMQYFTIDPFNGNVIKVGDLTQATQTFYRVSILSSQFLIKKKNSPTQPYTQHFITES